MTTEATAKKTSKARPVPSHPKYSEMIGAALKTCTSRHGYSRQKITEYILQTYKIRDSKTVSSRLKVALRRAVVSGQIQQTKGRGASGSFRSPEKAEKTKKSATVKRKPTTAKKPKTTQKSKKGDEKKPRAKTAVAKKSSRAKPAASGGRAKSAASPKKTAKPKTAKKKPAAKKASGKTKKAAAAKKTAAAKGKK